MKVGERSAVPVGGRGISHHRSSFIVTMVAAERPGITQFVAPPAERRADALLLATQVAERSPPQYTTPQASDRAPTYPVRPCPSATVHWPRRSSAADRFCQHRSAAAQFRTPAPSGDAGGELRPCGAG